MSRPPRARGLKQPDGILCGVNNVSRPPRARGLKRIKAERCFDDRRSRPPRARGLKPIEGGFEIRMRCRAPRGRVD